MLCGIDEAGRGPAIGPLVICGVIYDNDAELLALGVKDSKKLSAKKRLELYEILLEKVKCHIQIIDAPEIDNRAKRNLTLNSLEAVYSAIIINTLKPQTVIVDCPSTNKQTHIADIQRYMTVPATIIAEFKADENYPVVSAASIIAKVIRDRLIEQLKETYNIDFGSGYPSDPKTQAFLRAHSNEKSYTHIIRHTWSAVDKANQARLGDFTK
jgi:ribonuclease HII